MASKATSSTDRTRFYLLLWQLLAFHSTHAFGFNCSHDNAYLALGENNCQPYVTNILPTYGPAAGGTVLYIEGGYFERHSAQDTRSTIDIRFGYSNLTCEDIPFSNDTVILCKTPSIGDNSDLIGTRLNISIKLSNGVVLEDDQLFFTYKSNPVIYYIEPLKTFLRGGIIQTVIGEALNSVRFPFLNLSVSVNGIYKDPQPHPTLCTVVHYNKMHCPTPYINHTVLSVMTRRKRMDLGWWSSYYKFEIGFILDGVTNYDNVTNELGIGIGHIKVFHDPYFEEWDPGTQIFRSYNGDSTISINGHGLNFGAQMSDYIVTVSSSVCKVIDLNTTNLVCKPPLERPIHNDRSVDGAYQVSLKIGPIRIHVGYLKYYMARWDDPYFRIPIIATIAIALAILIACLVMRFCCGDPIGHFLKRRSTKPFHETPEESVYEMRPRDLIDMLDFDLQTIIFECLIQPATRMTLGVEVGKGNFGKVYSGFLRIPDQDQPLRCAIKTLKRDTDDVKDLSEFLEEATIMKDFQHPNVLTLYGVVIAQNIPYVLLPFMAHGDLRAYVSNPSNTYSVRELLDYGLQVAKGMSYLSSNKFVHRDLAARNCMIDDTKVVKIADFGLARDIYERDYYAVEDRRRPMPIKWMAPECLETFKFDSRSDVWSFGVTLWEVMVRGRKPYTGIDNLDLKRFLLRGCRLDKPTFCPDVIYALMLDCWQLDPKSRPMFPEIAERISKTLQSVRQLVPSTNSLPPTGAHDYLDMVSTHDPLGSVALEKSIASGDGTNNVVPRDNATAGGTRTGKQRAKTYLELSTSA